MLQMSKKEKEKTLEAIKAGKIDAADISFPNLIDQIALKINGLGLIKKLKESFKDKRDTNQKIPLELLLGLTVIAKMKLKTSLTDVPYAVTDTELMSELGFNMWDTDRNLEEGMFSEGVMRNLVGKYEENELIQSYNDYVKNEIKRELNINPTVHILDCTKVKVNLENENYEKSEVISYEGEAIRGYKLGTIRGLLDDSGIIEQIVFGGLKTHDLELCREMLMQAKHFKAGDILINDRGFLSRDIINHLKSNKLVDTYIPAKKNMVIHQDAVAIAKEQGKWAKHPNKKRKTQTIQLIKDMGAMWESDCRDTDVPINACVVHDSKDDEYHVFLTTDTEKTAKQIINTYELRPEIEEDYRQMKDFWKLEDFKSTKYNMITFHIVMTLIGYMYFQIYKNTEEGAACSGKSLPVMLKNFKLDKPKSIVVYSGQYFGIFSFFEFVQLFASLEPQIRTALEPILAQI